MNRSDIVGEMSTLFLHDSVLVVALQLALKHRQSKNHRQRIVVFVGSPINAEEAEVSVT